MVAPRVFTPDGVGSNPTRSTAGHSVLALLGRTPGVLRTANRAYLPSVTEAHRSPKPIARVRLPGEVRRSRPSLRCSRNTGTGHRRACTGQRVTVNMPLWWNRDTRRTQNAVPLRLVGSSPTGGTEGVAGPLRAHRLVGEALESRCISSRSTGTDSSRHTTHTK